MALGLNAAVFTIFNAYALRPAAVRDPYSLYEFTWRSREGFHSFSWREFEELRRSTSVFSAVFAGRRQVLARLNGRPAYGHLVTGNYFQFLGGEAVHGRTLRPDDVLTPSGNAVVVLAFSVWQREFAGDTGIVGQTISIDGHPVEVVGVAA